MSYDVYSLKWIRTLFVLVAILFLPVQLLFAQQFSVHPYAFRHLTVENGLSQSTVECLIQDNKGFVWIGTQDGLNRFDGYNFLHYRYNPDDHNSISSSYITCLAQAGDNHLLIGTESSGLNLLDILNNRFVVFTNQENNSKSISSNEIKSICHYRDQLYFIGTWGGGLNLLNLQTKEFTSFKHSDTDPASISNNFITAVCIGTDEKIYIGTRDEGINIFDPVSKKFLHVFHEAGKKNDLSNNNIQSVYADGNKTWIGDYDGVLNCYENKTGKIKQYPLPVKIPINDIIRMGNNELWLATFGEGIYVLKEQEGTFERIVNNPFEAGSVNSNSISRFFQSRDKVLWVGTMGGGINLYHKDYSNFINIDQQFIKNTLDYNQVNYSVIEDSEGIIWSGSFDSGLRAYHTSNGKVDYYRYDAKNKNTISNNSILSICEDDHHDIWIGTLGAGVNLIERKTGKINRYLPDTAKEHNLNERNIFCITQARDGKMFFGTQDGGVYTYDRVTKKLVNYKNGKGNLSVNNNVIYSIKEGKNKEVFICTQGGGLNILNTETGKFDYFLHDPENRNSISSNEIYCVYEDEDGLIWLGTISGGLSVIDRKHNLFYAFYEKDGLPNNDIIGILADEKGSLWMSTNKGICRFTYTKKLDLKKLDDPVYFSENISIKNYNSSDGLVSDEFAQGAYYRAGNGMMYFGGVKGVLGFRPSEINANSYSPNTVVTRIRNYKEELTCTDSSAIQVNHKNYLTIEFASLSFLTPEKNKYAIMFEGRDTAWNELGNTRSVSFLDLKPGDHVLKIRSSNNDGLWGVNPAFVKIRVNPPFYETWWFRITALFVFLAGIYIFYSMRVRQIKKEEQRKTAFNKELAEVEMKALRAQMNPHFIFNSLNSINKYIWANDQRKASEYLTRFSKLIRLILENSRHQSIPLDKDLEGLELYMQMESLRFEQHFEYKVELSEDIETESILIPPLLLQPFVENSIWHGLMPKETAGIIKIKISTRGEDLYCMIEDNGVGRKKALELKAKKISKHNSLGMKVTMDRIDILNQQKNRQSKVTFTDLYDDMGNPSGTRVELSIPLEYSF